MNMPYLELFDSRDDLSTGRVLYHQATILTAQRKADEYNAGAVTNGTPLRGRAIWIDLEASEDSKKEAAHVYASRMEKDR